MVGRCCSAGKQFPAGPVWTQFGTNSMSERCTERCWCRAALLAAGLQAPQLSLPAAHQAGAWASPLPCAHSCCAVPTWESASRRAQNRCLGLRLASCCACLLPSADAGPLLPSAAVLACSPQLMLVPCSPQLMQVPSFYPLLLLCVDAALLLFSAAAAPLLLCVDATPLPLSAAAAPLLPST